MHGMYVSKSVLVFSLCFTRNRLSSVISESIPSKTKVYAKRKKPKCMLRVKQVVQNYVRWTNFIYLFVTGFLNI